MLACIRILQCSCSCSCSLADACLLADLISCSQCFCADVGHNKGSSIKVTSALLTTITTHQETSQHEREPLLWPSLTSSMRCMIHWAMDMRQAELHSATVQANSVRHFRTSQTCMVVLGRAGVLCNCLERPSSVWPDFVSVGHNLRIETGRHVGLPRNERSCRRCKRL
jgi:hypothetical protein